MSVMTLVQVETRGNQEYIFGSNNLQQNIGASELVKQSTTQWLLDNLTKQGLKHNAWWNTAEDRLDFGVAGKPAEDRWRVADRNAQVEVIYAGGGNALLLFAGDKNGRVREFTRQLSNQLLKEARDLRLSVDAIELDWNRDALAQKHTQLRMQSAQNKMRRSPNAPMNGLGITACCDFTGQPVVDRDPDGRLVSRSIMDKLAHKNMGDERLHAILPRVRQHYYEFTRDFDQFGDKGEASYIAVVHVDGNQMGERFRMIAAAHPSQTDNTAYVDQIYALSLAVQNCSTAALRETVDTIIVNERDGYYGGIVPVRTIDGQAYLPFRPIVFGGDDTTFVCEGRLGLALAKIYLKALAATPLPGEKKGAQDGGPLYARAGVAVVKSHFPFSRAYDLAEELCRSAKEAVEQRISTKQGCILDWHFSTTGVMAPLQNIRTEAYTAEDGNSLLMRPLWVPLHQKEASLQYWQTWDNFDKVASAFMQDENWVGHRNKIKALREALRSGPKAVDLFLQTFRQPPLPEIPGQTRMPQEGWQDQQCGYFDVIEALDFYVPLRGTGGEA